MHFKLSLIFFLSIIETIINKFSVLTNVEARQAVSTQMIDLPDGYEPFPQFGVAYKLYETPMSWRDSALYCMADGASLAVIDSRDKIKEVNALRMDRQEWIHVGIIWMESFHKWVRYDTFTPVQYIPWAVGEPDGSGVCTGMDAEDDDNEIEDGLLDYDCEDLKAHFVCEIPLELYERKKK